MNECHYITDGNHHAFSMVQLCKKLMGCIGVNPERLRIEQLSAGEGIRFAEFMNDFSRKLREVGPLGKAEGIDADKLKLRFKAAAKLVPYIRLVERERLRVHCDTSEGYEKYYQSDAVTKLIQELIADKLAIGQIMALLREQPRSSGELSEILGLPPSEISKHLSNSARQGLARFDENQKRFVCA